MPSEDGSGNAAEKPLTVFDIGCASVIVASTFGFGISHWLSPDVLELAKDGLDPITIDGLPVPRWLQHRILFAGIGFIWSTSGVLLFCEFIASKTWIKRVTFIFHNLVLSFVFVAASCIACTVFWHAIFD